jgi:hypothetical protein
MISCGEQSSVELGLHACFGLAIALRCQLQSRRRIRAAEQRRRVSTAGPAHCDWSYPKPYDPVIDHQPFGAA